MSAFRVLQLAMVPLGANSFFMQPWVAFSSILAGIMAVSPTSTAQVQAICQAYKMMEF